MIMYNPDAPQEKTAVAECVHMMVRDALAMEGTVSVSSARGDLMSILFLNVLMIWCERVSTESDSGRRQVGLV